MDRRQFVALLPLAVRAMAEPHPHLQRAFIGTTGKLSQGIFVADFDASSGTFTPPKLAADLPGNDSMVLRKPDRLYSTGAVDGKAVVQGFHIADGALQTINQQPTGGAGANFLSAGAAGRVLMEANWGSGDVTTYQLAADGSISPPAQHIAYGDANHGPQPVQVHSRCHSILLAPGGRFVLVNDYGCDRIYIYRLNAATAMLLPHDPPFFAAHPGSAPRHLVFHPNGHWIYCNNELSNTIDLLDWDGKRGTLALRDSVSTLPADAPPKCRTADMVLSADSRFLYGSVRTLESFTTYAVEPDGRLRKLQFLPSEGTENRCITLDRTGRWLIAANQHSGDVAVLSRDPKSGLLGKQANKIDIPGACFVLLA